MRMGKIIDGMIEPVIQKAKYNTEHGKLAYTATKSTCVKKTHDNSDDEVSCTNIINSLQLFY